MCTTLVCSYQLYTDNALCLLRVDPILVFSMAKNRLTDSLLDTCLVLVRHRHLDEERSAIVLRQYSEECASFRQKWVSQTNKNSDIEAIYNLWMSYPHWQRCAEMLDVIHLVFSCVVRSLYRVDFAHVEPTALSEREMVCSLLSVRS